MDPCRPLAAVRADSPSGGAAGLDAHGLAVRMHGHNRDTGNRREQQLVQPGQHLVHGHRMSAAPPARGAISRRLRHGLGAGQQLQPVVGSRNLCQTPLQTVITLETISRWGRLRPSGWGQVKPSEPNGGGCGAERAGERLALVQAAAQPYARCPEHVAGPPSSIRPGAIPTGVPALRSPGWCSPGSCSSGADL